MPDGRLLELMDRLVLRLHDRGIPYVTQMRVSITMVILCDWARCLSKGDWVLAMALGALLLGIAWLEERSIRRHGAKEWSARRVRFRSSFLGLSVRALLWGLTLGAVKDDPGIVSIFSGVVLMLAYYHFLAIVPWEEPRRRREEEVKLAWTPAMEGNT